MSRVLLPLAQGCEEIEAVTVIDLLRRADIHVTVAGLAPGPVTASRGVVLVPDTTLDEAVRDTFDMIVLPGGGAGAENLKRDPRILSLLRDQVAAGRSVAAICAAPKVLAAAGVLEGRRATGFPGVLEAEGLTRTTLTAAAVEHDGNVITSRGPGTAMDFALALIERLEGKARRDAVEGPLQRA